MASTTEESESEWVEFCDLSMEGANRSSYLSKKLNSATSDRAEIVAHRFQTLQKLDHPNLLKCHKLLHLGDEFFILCDSVVCRSPITPESIGDLANISAQIVSLLSYLHKNNIWHGAIEPSGIFIDSSRKVKVLPPVKFLYDTIPLGINMFSKDLWDFGFSIIRLYRRGQSCSTFTNSSDEVLWRFLLCSMRNDLSQRWNASALVDHPFLKISSRWTKVTVPLRLKTLTEKANAATAKPRGTLKNSSPSLWALKDEIAEGFKQVMQEIVSTGGTGDRRRFLLERVYTSYMEAMSTLYEIGSTEQGPSVEKSGWKGPGQEGKSETKVVPVSELPEEMRNLGDLQTFFVAQHDGYRIEVLKKMKEITGSFCNSSLKNVSDKKHIHKLEVKLDPDHSQDPSEILECLRPYFDLKELEIHFYNGSKLPSWISDPSFTNLTSILLFSCTGCHFLPSLGKLPALKILHMIGLEEVYFIDTSDCRGKKSDGRGKRSERSSAFPRLEVLKIDEMPNLFEWTEIEDGDLRCLESVRISYCPKLLLLPSISHLYSLKHLEVRFCPRLVALPEGVFPDSVESVIID